MRAQMNLRCLCVIFVHLVLEDQVYSEIKRTTASNENCDVFDDQCYSRLLSGKRIIDYNAKRSFTSHSIRDCSKACTSEKNFFCRGFNYRHNNRSHDGAVCELTSMPYVPPYAARDQQYDYYERDPKCNSFRSVKHGTHVQKPSNLVYASDARYPYQDNENRKHDFKSYDLMFHRFQPSYGYLPATYAKSSNKFDGRYEPHQDVGETKVNDYW